ncbi:MAG: DUF4838 domain-containing protein [Planctomycetota bacterium]|jgi:hypothetical protein
MVLNNKKVRFFQLTFCFLLVLVMTLFCSCSNDTLAENKVIIEPDNIVIVLPEKADNIKKFAADELQKHLALITGKKPVIVTGKNIDNSKLPIFVGVKKAEDKTALDREEARYFISKDSIYIYGEDTVEMQYDTLPDWAFHRRNHTGTMFAVYSFLEQELGVVWVAPGDEGISYRAAEKLALAEKTFSWKPSLPLRIVRPTTYGAYFISEQAKHVPEDFRFSKELIYQKRMDSLIWSKRMRTGASIYMRYGHAFTHWWKEYGKEHPEYFALNTKGKREPWSPKKPDRIKMCVTNKGLHKEIVKKWLKKAEEETINLCENDSAGYCLCEDCLKLDVGSTKEKLSPSMSDRYIWFSKQVLAEAKKHRPGTKGVMYAYGAYNTPPKRERVPADLILGVVPRYMLPRKDFKSFFAAWKKRGASSFFIRPNDLHADIGIPLGFEKLLYDNLQAAIKMGSIGADYDTIQDYWASSGVANYILCRALMDPEKSFEHWENEYCSAFGKASSDVKRYLKIWRKIWENRIVPDRETMFEKSGNVGYGAAFYKSVGKYFTDRDFDIAEKILKAASVKISNSREQKLLDNLIFAVKHGRLIINAINEDYPDGGEKNQIEAILALRDLRKEKLNEINIAFPRYFRKERLYCQFNVKTSAEFFEKAVYYERLPEYWSFKIDSDKQGVKKGWHKAESKVIAGWEKMKTGQFWRMEKKGVKPETAKQLENYGGHAWYAVNVPWRQEYKDKKVYLVLGNVTTHFEVYVNGKKAGERLLPKKSKDRKKHAWRDSVRVRIDKFIIPGSVQNIAIDVEGMGRWSGILKRAWLVAE